VSDHESSADPQTTALSSIDSEREPEALPGELRRERMLSALRQREFLRVTELGEMFGISEVTVRSDLDTLAGDGRVMRVRGGAMAARARQGERPFEEMRAAQAAEKLRIGRAAAGLVSSGETVILDVGTTTTAVARALIAREDLREVTIFTNAINIALELEPAIPRFSVVVLGGTLRPLQHSLVDPLGGLALDQINANVVFLGCNGVDPAGGVTNINLPEAELKRRMLAAARRRVVVADGSKVGSVELARLCPVDEIDLLVTDASADDGLLALLRERDVDVLVAT
jgi:DeoR family transcriptional regulator, aga operon transcriptional repressor